MRVFIYLFTMLILSIPTLVQAQSTVYTGFHR